MAWTPSEERAFFKRVLDVVNDFDPYSLGPGTPGGPPLDEWETEARAIESLLINKGRIEFADFRAIWLKSVGDDLARSEKETRPVLDALNALVPQNPS
jgi:hypothetical protein